MDTPVQIIRYTDIGNAVLLAGHDIDVVDWRHGQAMDSRVRGNDKIVGFNSVDRSASYRAAVQVCA